MFVNETEEQTVHRGKTGLHGGRCCEPKTVQPGPDSVRLAAVSSEWPDKLK
jgi:hypothetical protein